MSGGRYVIARSRSGTLERMNQLVGDGTGRQFEPVFLERWFIQAWTKNVFVGRPTRRILPVDPALEMSDGILADAGCDWAGFYQYDADRRVLHFESQGITQTFHGELAGDVGTAKRQCGKAEDR